jgi:hypothetical protein
VVEDGTSLQRESADTDDDDGANLSFYSSLAGQTLTGGEIACLCVLSWFCTVWDPCSSESLSLSFPLTNYLSRKADRCMHLWEASRRRAVVCTRFPWPMNNLTRRAVRLSNLDSVRLPLLCTVFRRSLLPL